MSVDVDDDLIELLEMSLATGEDPEESLSIGEGKDLLGCTVKDSVTEFTGTVTEIVHYLDGTSRVLVEAIATDGGIASAYIDVGRITR